MSHREESKNQKAIEESKIWTSRAGGLTVPRGETKKKGKQIREKTAESQGIVAQGNSNPYNTALHG